MHLSGGMGVRMDTTDAQAELIALIKSDYQRLVGVVAVACESTSVAEDAVQEALVRAWEQVARGKTFHHLAGWVVVVALNHARHVGRRRRAEQRAVTRLADRPSPGDDNREDVVDLDQAVASLRGRQRQVVVLYYMLGLDVRTTAEVLGIGEGTVKANLHRARATLAARLAQPEPQPPSEPPADAAPQPPAGPEPSSAPQQEETERSPAPQTGTTPQSPAAPQSQEETP